MFAQGAELPPDSRREPQEQRLEEPLRPPEEKAERAMIFDENRHAKGNAAIGSGRQQISTPTDSNRRDSKGSLREGGSGSNAGGHRFEIEQDHIEPQNANAFLQEQYAQFGLADEPPSAGPALEREDSLLALARQEEDYWRAQRAGMEPSPADGRGGLAPEPEIGSSLGNGFGRPAAPNQPLQSSLEDPYQLGATGKNSSLGYMIPDDYDDGPLPVQDKP